MNRLFVTAAASVLWVGAAHADAFTDQVVARYQDMGFTFVEVQGGPTQVKVEAIKDSQKLEVIYDRVTGAILKQEQERADADESDRTGVQVRERDRDFLSDDDDDDDDRSGHHGGDDDDDDDDDDNSGPGGGDDDDDDDDDGDDHGGSDDD